MKRLRVRRTVMAGVIGFIMVGMASCRSSEELKSEQYFVVGQQLYMTHCTNCHQMDGKGMANLYPPIAGSSIISDKARLARIVQYGMSDTIVLNGKPFSRPMPPNPKLTEIEIAEIVSFVSMKWGKDSLYTPIDFVRKALVESKRD